MELQLPAELQEAIVTVIGMVITGVALYLARAVKAYLVAKAAEIDSDVGYNLTFVIQEAVRAAVLAAEQVGAIDGIESASRAKFKNALQYAETLLAARGIELDLEELAALIEAEVYKQFKQGK